MNHATGTPRLRAHPSSNHIRLGRLQLHDHKLVRAWPVRPTTKFAAPVTQVRALGTPAAVRYHALLADRRTVCTWTSEAVDFDRAVRKTVWQ